MLVLPRQVPGHDGSLVGLLQKGEGKQNVVSINRRRIYGVPKKEKKERRNEQAAREQLKKERKSDVPLLS